MTRLAIFCLAAATLVLELLLTRVFDVILTPNLAYMIIACAMFAFGLAGVYLAVRPMPATPARLGALCAAFAVTTLVLLPVLNGLPFDYEALGREPVVQVLSFTGMYVALVAPFFLSGLVLTLVFSAGARSIQTLYCWDLAGAALGCLLVVPLIRPIGPGGLLFLAAAGGIIASGLLGEHRTWQRASVVVALMLVALPAWRSPAYFEFSEHLAKRGVKEARLEGRIEVSRWDPVSKIDVIEQRELDPTTGQAKPFTTRKHIAYDGGTQSSHVFPFDGDFARLRGVIERGDEPLTGHFWHRGVLASHYIARDTHPRVLIIGSAGGQETKAALTYGAASVDAVELVGTVVELVRGPYADFGGRIFLDPRVQTHAAEGRSFLRAHTGTYDIIQIHSNHTSSSVAAGTGAMAPNYLQTADAYREYFQHLSPTGILHINHFGFGRMITTAALAWAQLGRTDFARHVVVVGMTTPEDPLPTLLIRMQPWTRAEVDELVTFFSRVTPGEFEWTLMQDPLDSRRSFLPEGVFAGRIAPHILQRAATQLRPTTDDQPFFNFLRKRLGPVEPDAQTFTDPTTAAALNSQLRRGIVPMDVAHLFVTAGVSLVCAILFVAVPLRRSRIRDQATAVTTMTMIYFSCLGAGFILLELVLIQVFMKVVGYPVYTYALVICTLLLGAGLGSLASARLAITPASRWWWPFVAVLVYGGLLVLGYPYVVDRVLASSDAMRMAVSVALIAPLGVALGAPFPLGILLVERTSPEAIAWAWGLNGLFTIIGSLASVFLGIAIGFQATLVVALGLYGVGFAAFAGLRSVVLQASAVHDRGTWSAPPRTEPAR